MSTNNNTQMNFISLDQLKARLGATEVAIVRNPNTSKLFANASNGQNLKVEQSIDFSMPLRYMYQTDELFTEGCIVNITPANAPVFTF